MKADTTEIKYICILIFHSQQQLIQMFQCKYTKHYAIIFVQGHYKSWGFCSTVNRIFHEKQISVQYSTKNILQLFLYNKHSNEYIFILGVCTTIEIFCAHFDDRLSSKKIHSYNHFFAGMYMSSLLLDGWILQQQQAIEKTQNQSKNAQNSYLLSELLS